MREIRGRVFFLKKAPGQKVRRHAGWALDGLIFEIVWSLLCSEDHATAAAVVWGLTVRRTVNKGIIALRGDS